jgi:hypothetical protein
VKNSSVTYPEIWISRCIISLAEVEFIYYRRYRNSYERSASLKMIASLEEDSASPASDTVSLVREEGASLNFWIFDTTGFFTIFIRKQ